MFSQLINIFNNFFKENISTESLSEIENTLLQVNIYLKAETLISIIFLTSILLFFISLIIVILFKLSIIISIILTALPTIFIGCYIIYKKEHRKEEIENDLPDYLHQISSLLKVGLGLESALSELSKNTQSPLNDEIKRVLLEIHLGKTFNDSLMDMTKRVKLENLEHVFGIIMHTRESGGNLADILDDIANDLSDTLLLKKQRKSSVMMSVMFLLVSSIIATPFALGMIGLYSEFIEQVGRYNPLTSTIPTASIGYIFIHSILVSLLLGIVMYSDYKKGIKYLFIIPPVSLAVYFISKSIFSSILGIGVGI